MTKPTFEELVEKVALWGIERNITEDGGASAHSQALKTQEEVCELLSALERGDDAETVDAYGDILVTLINSSRLAGVDLVAALASAYDVIKDRKGRMVAGQFVKEGDLFEAEPA